MRLLRVLDLKKLDLSRIAELPWSWIVLTAIGVAIIGSLAQFVVDTRRKLRLRAAHEQLDLMLDARGEFDPGARRAAHASLDHRTQAARELELARQRARDSGPMPERDFFKGSPTSAVLAVGVCLPVGVIAAAFRYTLGVALLGVGASENVAWGIGGAVGVGVVLRWLFMAEPPLFDLRESIRRRL